MGGQTGQTTTNQTSTIQLPAWVNNASQNNYQFAQQVASQPLTQFAGQQVADVSPGQQQAWNLAQNAGQAGQSQFNAATGAYLGALSQAAPTISAQPLNFSGTATQVNPTAISGSQIGLPNNYQAVTGSQIGPLGGAQQITPQNITAGSLANTSLAPYMNPYTNKVINASTNLANEQLQQNLMGQNTGAAGAGAFGGSRLGIQNAAAQAQNALNIANFSAQQQQANVTNAQQQAQQDISRNLAAQQANQQAGLTAGQANQSAALTAQGQQLQGALANQSSTNAANLANQQARLSAGAQTLQGAMANQSSANQANLANQSNMLASQQANQGANLSNQNMLINAALQNQAQQIGVQQSNQQAMMNNISQQLQGAQGLGALGSTVNSALYPQYLMLSGAGAQQQQQQQNEINAQMNQFGQAAGYNTQNLNTLLSALGMSPYGSTQTTNGTTTQSSSPDIFQSLLGGMSMFMGLSDKEDKTDIKKLGNDGSGLPLYAYRYKGDPKSYPKVVGPMAQDIEKRNPSAVGSVGGHKVLKFAPRGQIGALGNV